MIKIDPLTLAVCNVSRVEISEFCVHTPVRPRESLVRTATRGDIILLRRFN